VDYILINQAPYVGMFKSPIGLTCALVRYFDFLGILTLLFSPSCCKSTLPSFSSNSYPSSSTFCSGVALFIDAE
jgi:hypothetical protein